MIIELKILSCIECMAKEEMREKETTGQYKEPSRKFTAKGLAEAKYTSIRPLKTLKTWTPTPKNFINRKTDGSLSTHKEKRNKPPHTYL
jgi:hypothetical protein